MSYTVSGSTTYPGIVNLNITVTNNDIIAHNYGIVVLIGSNDHSVWWGPDFYRDNLPPCMDVQNASSQWWIQASICTGSLGLGKSFQVARRIEIANDSRVRDALVIVFDVQNGSHELVRLMKRDVIHVR